MGPKELSVQSKNQMKPINVAERRSDINYINTTFKIGDTVEHLHKMMKEVTAKEIDAKNVNAACHCVSQLNATINTVINAAKFLRDGQ